MTFSPKQIDALSAKLDAASVKKRPQAGRQLSYIEGWHVIAEANRIFGFDGWTRETAEMRQLGEPREVDGKWRVSWYAKVRVTVLPNIVRDGCGYGSGIDKDLGQAHESALKEAETDAMKRALMTFGNPFGLALYDKDQENVERAPATSKPASAASELSRIAKTRDELAACKTLVEVDGWWTANQQAIDALDENSYKAIAAAAKDRKRDIRAASSNRVPVGAMP